MDGETLMTKFFERNPVVVGVLWLLFILAMLPVFIFAGVRWMDFVAHLFGLVRETQ